MLGFATTQIRKRPGESQGQPVSPACSLLLLVSPRNVRYWPLFFFGLPHYLRMQDDQQIQPFPYPSPPEPIHSELTDELDRIRELRIGSNRFTFPQIQAVACPTCGARPDEKCELNSGQPRSEPHRERRLAAWGFAL